MSFLPDMMNSKINAEQILAETFEPVPFS